MPMEVGWAYSLLSRMENLYPEGLKNAGWEEVWAEEVEVVDMVCRSMVECE